MEDDRRIRRRRDHRLARWFLERCSPDGTPLYCDLVEAYEARRGRTRPGVAWLWFGREVIVACLYGQRDRWAEKLASAWPGARVGAPRQALRALRRRPGYSLTVVITVGLAAGSIGGLGGLARVIGVPVEPELDSVRVIVGTNSQQGWPRAYLSFPELADLEARVPGLNRVGIFLPNAFVAIGHGVESVPASVVLANANYFEVLAARAQIGRLFTDGESAGLEGRVAVISNRIWRDRFGEDRRVIGKSVEVAGANYAIIGVLSEDFRDVAGGGRTDVWLPLAEARGLFGAVALTERNFRWMMAVAHIDPERFETLHQDVARVQSELQREYPIAHRGRGYSFLELEDWWFGGLQRAVRIMLAAGIVLLLLVFGNLAVLFRVRGQERAPEMSLRAALGAERGTLVGVVLTEAAMLACASALIGLVIAVAFLEWGGVQILVRLPRFATPRVDVLTTFCSAGAIIPLALVFGWVGPHRRVGVRVRPRRWLLAGEAALAAALLTAAGALVEDAREVAHTTTGYEPRGLLTAKFDLRVASTEPTLLARAANDRIAFARDIVAAAPTVPGVASAALVGPSVLGRANAHLLFVPEGLDPVAHSGRWMAQRLVTTPGALSTLGVRVLRGRDLEWNDNQPNAPAAVVDERIANQFWPAGDALGSRFCINAICGPPFTIVGVAETAKHRGRTTPDAFVVGDIYIPYLTANPNTATLVVRTDGTAGNVAERIRTLVGELAPSAVLSDVQWMDDRLRATEFVQRTTAALVAAYAIVAGLLALLGTYGLVAFHLRRRWRDMAVRTALGARSAVLARALMRDAIVPVIGGAAAGAALGLAFVPSVTAAASRVGGIGGWGMAESALVFASLVSAGLGAAAIPLLRLKVMRPMAVLRAD